MPMGISKRNDREIGGGEFQEGADSVGYDVE